MATILLGAVGNAAFPGVGGILGAAVGSIIDSQLVAPAITRALGGNSGLRGPRIDDRSLQTASEGSARHFIIGPQNRTAGTIIWEPDLIEEEVSGDSHGGKGGGATAPGQTRYKYSAHFAVAFCKNLGPISRFVKIWADGKVVYENGVLDARIQDIRFYRGTSNQMPDSLMESIEGAGNVPGYRDTAYMVFEKFDLTDFSNRPPQIEALVEAQTAISVGEAIGLIFQLGGLTPEQYDVTRVPKCLLGFIATGPQTPARMLEPIFDAYNLLVQEVGGKLVVFAAGDETQIDVGSEDCGAHDDGETVVLPFTIVDPDEANLPSDVLVSYSDPAHDWQRGTQPDRRRTATAYNVEQVDFPLTIESNFAKSIARRILWDGVANGNLSGQLPPSYLGLAENDVLRIPFENEIYTVRIDDLTWGANYIFEFDGRIVQMETADQDGESEPSTITPPSVYTPPAVTLYILDLPSLDDVHRTVPGMYTAIAATDPDARWLGASVFESASEGGDYASLFSESSEATMGTALTVLLPGPIGYFDNYNSVDVELTQGELSSKTEAQILAGENRILIGNEIVRARFAVQIAARQYRLSGLVRGDRDTGEYVATHAAGERVIVLDSHIRFTPKNTSDIGVTRYYKGVARAGLVADATAIPSTFVAANMRTFSPAWVRGARDASGNLTIRWVPRYRGIGRIFGAGQHPRVDGLVFEIDILNMASTIVRTLRVSDVLEAAYTAADQASDGLVPGESVMLIVYHVGQFGRGNPARATV